MFSKSNKKERLDAEQREQYEYARKRIKQKKGLMTHFIIFLVGAILLLVIDLVLKKGHETLMKDWSVWVVLAWVFLLLIHVFNVFVTNKFMGKEWEDKQLEKLKKQQETRIAQLKKQAVQEVTVDEVKAAREVDALQNTPVKKNAPNQLPPESK
ncbi:2TM domain-containing protein [Marinirhabdus gelatinilytica]|uniref:2TM domain-containing protein n=1 Tax=Marinirhabdus gelatinilytica TaxID=1703343 RepID=A0A370Q667_9FLAO|nr:2TM domain-containing protein [Marinirhabdus gelatinilytica]RDK83854.1 2TM domain-containing protein [Marinirhabdus gelatinilytica]